MKKNKSLIIGIAVVIVVIILGIILFNSNKSIDTMSEDINIETTEETNDIGEDIQETEEIETEETTDLTTQDEEETQLENQEETTQSANETITQQTTEDKIETTTQQATENKTQTQTTTQQTTETTTNKTGDVQDGKVWMEGFGWIDAGDPNSNQGEVVDSDGDINKQVGTMD